jgi:murein DD-endopeptidase MepM/ murein hydrolase activator NlpD
VHAIGSGIVVQKGFRGGAGNMLMIRHNSVYATSYMHLQRYAANVGAGSHVSQGQLIGYVGSTGLSSGPHLDFRFYKNGKPVDPLKVESPPSLPVRPELKAKFDSVKVNIVKQLDNIK